MDSHTPTTCKICQRRATGIGISNHNSTDWLCVECALLVERIKDIKRFDAYELKALDGGVEAVGDYIDTIGGNVDLGTYDDLERRMLVKAAVIGYGNRLRKLIASEAPF